MPDLDMIRRIARQTLILPTVVETSDNWLWDRTLRCQKNVDMLCRLPELADRANSIDRFCLVVATYFSESGFSRYAREQADPKTTTGDVNYKKLSDYSSHVVSEKLSKVLTDTRIEKINEIIIESCNRFTETTEAMILSDARSLEDLGAVGLLNEFRRQILCGKGVSEILKSWERKIEYGYWQARLKESFRFEAASLIARKRFEAVESFMAQLITENQAEDLDVHIQKVVEY